MNDYKEIEFKAGDIIYDAQMPLDVAWFIMEGSVELDLTLGNKTTTIKLGENQFVGGVSVAVKEKAKREELSYNAIARAVVNVKAIEVPIADIEAELELCPPLLKAWFASFIHKMLITVEQLSQ